jgi:hypothetical protein
VVAGASAATALAVVATAVIADAALHPRRAAVPQADPEASLSPAPSASPSPSETPSAEPTPVDTATAHVDPTPGPGDPVPRTVPGRSTARILFANLDPEYDAVFWIGSQRYGPYAPWTRTPYITVETYAGLQFRLEFPKRHNCDTSARPLERPIEGDWGLMADRVYKSRDCAGLSVFGEPIRSLSWPPERWTPDPMSPSPTHSATTPPPSPSPSTTPSPSQSSEAPVV